MAVRFIGDVTWRDASEIVWSTNDYGLDIARIPYRGAVTGKKAFEDKLRRWMPILAYPRMYMTHYSDDGGLIFPTVDVHFVGIRKDVPPPRITDTTTWQVVSTTASVDVDGTPTDVSMEATYVTSRTTYQWVEISQPSPNPRYSTVRNAVNPTPRSYKIRGDDGGPVTVDYSTFVTLFNSLRREVIASDYVRDEIVEGRIWQCSIVVDQILTGA
jgi:hypothetical protein